MAQMNKFSSDGSFLEAMLKLKGSEVSQPRPPAPKETPPPPPPYSQSANEIAADQPEQQQYTPQGYYTGQQLAYGQYQQYQQPYQYPQYPPHTQFRPPPHPAHKFPPAPSQEGLSNQNPNYPPPYPPRTNYPQLPASNPYGPPIPQHPQITQESNKRSFEEIQGDGSKRSRFDQQPPVGQFPPPSTQNHFTGFAPPPAPEKELKDVIDKMVTFVAKNGPAFETKARTNGIGNPKFKFLYDPQSSEHRYYKWKLQQEIQANAPPPPSPSASLSPSPSLTPPFSNPSYNRVPPPSFQQAPPHSNLSSPPPPNSSSPSPPSSSSSPHNYQPMINPDRASRISTSSESPSPPPAPSPSLPPRSFGSSANSIPTRVSRFSDGPPPESSKSNAYPPPPSY